MKGIIAQWQRMTTLQQVITIVIIAVILYFLVKYLKQKKETADRIVQEKAEVTVLQESGVKQSYKDSTYEGWGNELFNYMDGSGTKMAGITRIFGYLHNDLDFIKLEKAFGLRISSYAWSWFTSPTGLMDWLKGDLNGDDIKEINKQLKLQGLTKQIK